MILVNNVSPTNILQNDVYLDSLPLRVGMVTCCLFTRHCVASFV